ncbi:FK506-binding protein 3 [Kluyveromyces marxianus]|nr:FK506-binding protein 3 [Kluyveromyces marxianus]
MSDLLPLAAYNLNIEPYTPTPAIDVTTPVTVRITMAAIDPEALDDEANPSTLRIIKRNPDFDDEDDADALLGDYDEDELDVSEEEEEEKPKDKKSKSKSKSKKEESEDELEDESDEDDEEGDEDDEFQEFVLATLSPKTQYQQSLDLVIAPEEEVQFIVTGSYRVSLTGNFVKHPFDTPDYDEEDSEEGEESYDEDEDDYLTPDEDADLEELEEASDIEAKIQELVEKEQSKSKKNNKRKQPEPEEEEEEQEAPAPVEETKKAKKAKKEKKVEFKKDLEEGPTPAKKEEKKEKKEKPKTKVLEGGIIIEDRVVGTGKACKKGSKVGMRYIGKLKNGKVFDKNTSGKPFVFNLGRGEVIKGWDIGVAGMAVGGERRIVIPAPYAYGKQALPGIPANSELTFDVKLVSLK